MQGCMVGPAYKRPATVANKAESFFYSPQKTVGRDEQPEQVGQWWRRFGDETTEQLVEKALANNNDIKSAAARVLQSRAQLEEAFGRRLPQVDYNISRTRAKSSFNFGGGRFSPITTNFEQGFSVSYVLDVFGKLKRAQRAAWADMLSSQAAQQAVVNTLISEVVRSRIQIATLQNELAIAVGNTKNWQKNLDIIERRYSAGLLGPLDVRLARENLAASQAAERSVELLLINAQNSLDILLGQRPASGGSLAGTLPDIPRLSAVPAGVPAKLLDRRPDIKQAEFALEAANERIGVSIAQLYPDLNLTGNYGRGADTFRDLFRHESEIYSAVFRLAQPVFSGGQLKAQVAGAEANFERLAADYAQKVIIAMKEVEDALASEMILNQRLEYLAERFEQASAAEKLANQRYLRGIEQLITVLEAERRRRIAENELNIVKGRLWQNRVDLFLALGGDWVS